VNSEPDSSTTAVTPRAPQAEESPGVKFRRAFGAFFLPIDLRDAAQFRLQREAARVRVIVTALVLLSIPFVPGLTVRDRVLVAVVLAGYVSLTSFVTLVVANRDVAVASALNIAVGHLTIFGISMILSDLLTVFMFAYVIGVISATIVSGVRAGTIAAAASVGLMAIAEYNAPSADRHDLLTFLMFSALQLSLVLLVNSLTRERRRVATNLARLHLAMRSVSSTPSLQETLDSIVESVAEAVGATVSGILLLEGDQLVLAAPRNVREVWPTENLGELASAELDATPTSPLARCMRTGETVVITDAESDHRFPEWSSRWSGPMHALGLRSLVIVPLRLSGERIGVMTACFTWIGAIDSEEVGLLEAYADQTSLVIVRAQAYERERSAAEKLSQTDRLKSEFLAMVSHELRTPLTAVKGFVDTVLLHWDRLDDDRRRELLRRASGNADELARLIGQLLDFSRIDADRIEVRPVVCNVRELVEAVLTDVAPVLASHVVRVHVAPELRVSCDPEAFDHIIMNLLSNAVKFSPKESEVEIHAREDGEIVVVSVIDHGVGITPEDQLRIFERFYQSSAPANSRRGTGIGLAIVKRFVDLQGGRVWVESELGCGSTFSFTLANARTVHAEA
jgi:signal transduction histidine kinase